MDKPLVSVVIPTFQRRELVTTSVRRLLVADQAGTAEIVVVVDGSTDGTAVSLHGLGDTRVIVVEQSNQGISAARNHGADVARAPILLFLDDDMRVESGFFEAHARAMTSEVDAVMGRMALDPASPTTYLTKGVGEWSDELDRELRTVDSITDPRLIFAGHLAVRRAQFEALGGFEHAFTRDGRYGNEDVDFASRLLAAGGVVRYAADAVAAQYYNVTARQHLARTRDLGATDRLLAARTDAGREVLGEALANHSLYRRWARALLLRWPNALAVIAWPNTLIACRDIDRGRMDDVTTNRLRRSTSIAYHRGAKAARRSEAR
jgi:glycosyltransferase involved in cell wall biosynthesis